METKTADFSTKDFNEAAMLFAFKVPFITVRRENGVCYFQFKNSSQVAELLNSFFSGNLMANLRDFTDAQRRIKDLIYKGERHG